MRKFFLCIALLSSAHLCGMNNEKEISEARLIQCVPFRNIFIAESFITDPQAFKLQHKDLSHEQLSSLLEQAHYRFTNFKMVPHIKNRCDKASLQEIQSVVSLWPEYKKTVTEIIEEHAANKTISQPIAYKSSTAITMAEEMLLKACAQKAEHFSKNTRQELNTQKIKHASSYDKNSNELKPVEPMATTWTSYRKIILTAITFAIAGWFYCWCWQDDEQSQEIEDN